MKINLFIIGMHRAGTTYLYNQLSKNENIYSLPIKENNFFVDNFFLKNKVKNSHRVNNDISKVNLNNLNKLYSYYLDASVNHFYSKQAPKKLFHYNKVSKIIIIHRKPIDRLVSHYKMDYYSNFNNRSIENSIIQELSNNIIGSDLGYLEMSLFKKYYSNWNKLFNDRILVIDFDKLNDLDYLNKILSNFLKVKINIVNLNKVNSSINPRFKNFNKLIQIKYIKNFLFMLFGRSFINKYKSFLYSKNNNTSLSNETKFKLQDFFINN